jgi:arginyl-tRNA synthetase
MEEQIRNATTEAIAEICGSDVTTSDISFAVEWPAEMLHGDYAVNAAMAAAKALGKNPRETRSYCCEG